MHRNVLLVMTFLFAGLGILTPPYTTGLAIFEDVFVVAGVVIAVQSWRKKKQEESN